jgi:hypothetical protein
VSDQHNGKGYSGKRFRLPVSPGLYVMQQFAENYPPP